MERFAHTASVGDASSTLSGTEKYDIDIGLARSPATDDS
jgi:hypothetical protein